MPVTFFAALPIRSLSAPGRVMKLSPEKIEAWHEKYLLKLMDLTAELGIKSMPMFWGVAFGWEVATGYPWGFWSGAGFDLVKEGQERFVTKTRKLREHARKLGLYLCHEIHPGTGAMCADDFNMLVDICDGDKCLGVNADPSHCWEGETWEQRFLKVGARVYDLLRNLRSSYTADLHDWRLEVHRRMTPAISRAFDEGSPERTSASPTRTACAPPCAS